MMIGKINADSDDDTDTTLLYSCYNCDATARRFDRRVTCK